MFSLTQNIIILVSTLTASLTIMAVLNKVWPLTQRRYRNDLIGWQLSVLGTTYAVLLGFMLYTVWSNFGAAELNAELEASALRNVNRLAEGLPAPLRSAMVLNTRNYATAVVDGDWPAMALRQLPERSHRINETMWQTLIQAKDLSPTETIAEDHALSELSELTAHRRTRLLQSAYHLPFILWCVLLTGGALMLLSVSMFGSSSTRLHAFQVFSLTLIMTLAMLAIADLDQPFQGWVHIDNFAFRRALEYMSSQ